MGISSQYGAIKLFKICIDKKEKSIGRRYLQSDIYSESSRSELENIPVL
jgi:hypothetical protein